LILSLSFSFHCSLSLLTAYYGAERVCALDL
jgi:hypothetical protein